MSRSLLPGTPRESRVGVASAGVFSDTSYYPGTQDAHALFGGQADFLPVVFAGASCHADLITRRPAVVRRGPPGAAMARHPRLRAGLHRDRGGRVARPGPGDRLSMVVRLRRARRAGPAG